MSQRLKQDGKLREAREQALICAQQDCPLVLSGDCTAWLGELDGAIASVIVDVRDASGQAVTDARVSVDGADFAANLDGRALPLDPGERRFRVTLPSGEVLARTLTIVEGKKGQYLRFDVAPAPAAPPPPAPRRRHAPALLYGSLALGVMGGVGFAYFGLQGNSDEDELERSCAPACPQGDMNALRRTYLAADVSLGIGVVALGAFGYLWLTNDAETRSVGLVPTQSGAALGFRERF